MSLIGESSPPSSHPLVTLPTESLLALSASYREAEREKEKLLKQRINELEK